MAAKQKAVVNVPLERMSKAVLIRTVKTLRKRETTLLNRIAKLEVNNLVTKPLLDNPVVAYGDNWFIDDTAAVQAAIDAPDYVAAIGATPAKLPWEL